MINETKIVWMGAGIITVLGFILIIVGLTGLGIIILSALLIWIGISLKIIKAPEIGLLFKMGKFGTQLEPGWYLGIPLVWDIETRTTEIQQIHFQEKMYTKTKKEISLRGGIYYKLENAGKSINLPEKTIEIDGEKTTLVRKRIKDVVLSKLKWQIGQKEFGKLLPARKEIEEEIIKDANGAEELEKDGYEVTGVEIADLEEKIESEAAKKREIGTAEAEVDKKKAEAIADPLKGNYPAAIAMVAGTIGDKIVGRILETVKKKQPEGGK